MIRILGTRDGLKDRDSEQFFGCYRVIGTANAHIDRYESSFGGVVEAAFTSVTGRAVSADRKTTVCI